MAGRTGSGAFPSVATLVRYTGLSERTVRTCLDRLEAGGIIRPCDPDLLAARVKRADRRPQGWDLDLTLARDDLHEPGVTVPESQSPVRRAGLAPIERPHHERPPNGVQPPHPAGAYGSPGPRGAAVAPRSRDEVQPAHRRVQPTWPRGAAVAPEPSTEPSLKPSAAPGPTRTRAAQKQPVARRHHQQTTIWQPVNAQREGQPRTMTSLLPSRSTAITSCVPRATDPADLVHQPQPDALAGVVGVGARPVPAADRPHQRGVPYNERIPRPLVGLARAPPGQ